MANKSALKSGTSTVVTKALKVTTKAAKVAATKGNGKGKGKAATKARAPRKAATKFDASAKITVLKGGIPKRKGSAEEKRFAQYRSGMTVGDAMEKGMNALNFTRDIHRDCISIAGYPKNKVDAMNQAKAAKAAS